MTDDHDDLEADVQDSQKCQLGVLAIFTNQPHRNHVHQTKNYKIWRGGSTTHGPRTIWFSNQDFQIITRTTGCVFSEKVIAFLTISKTFL